MGPGLSTLREVDDRDSEPEAGVDGVAGAAGRLVEVTDADAAVLGEMAVAQLHAAAEIVFRGENHFIRPAFDLFIGANVFFRPAGGLLPAGEHEDQPDVGIGFAQAEHRQRREGVKAERAARAEIPHALVNELKQLLLKAFLNVWELLRRKIPVAGETAGLIFHCVSVLFLLIIK
ncbi:hypothetical protein CLOSTMETH_03667 [[Clostridium] methylpentosum DSM 5476]|uniref:Uncharacterized protein n=1 Tax=[Clostridium] methylpentosum DSM 5476 TaxID=537013 RepID=C0EIH2_9FIRM|nr:hypothetical protein CLOSTMETH_03667 [[Clostridium] methylpentosum DSM 5476]